MRSVACLVSGLIPPPIGQDFVSANFWLSWRQDFAQKADYSLCGFFGKVLAKSWKILENLYRKTVLHVCKNLGKIRTVQKSRRLKTKRTKNCEKVFSLLYRLWPTLAKTFSKILVYD